MYERQSRTWKWIISWCSNQYILSVCFKQYWFERSMHRLKLQKFHSIPPPSLFVQKIVKNEDSFFFSFYEIPLVFLNLLYLEDRNQIYFIWTILLHKVQGLVQKTEIVLSCRMKFFLKMFGLLIFFIGVKYELRILVYKNYKNYNFLLSSCAEHTYL